MKYLLTGNEAIARGAWEAGVLFASAYPGTPSTEILKNLLTYEEIDAEWSPNEKVSFEAAAGASMAGVRSLTSTKHVGLNVAADPLFTFAYTGVNGGMVVVNADEPGQHSSQNEQDNRYYAQSAKIPMLEPSNSQECKDMMLAAYELSEAYDTPVLLRVTTRICHSKTIVECGERQEGKTKPYVKDPAKNLMVPAFATKRRVIVEERMNKLKETVEHSPLNYIEKGGKIGVVASGVCYHYAKEVFGDEATYLKLGFTNPLPTQLLKEFYQHVDQVYVIEENDPYLEMWIKASGFDCHGKDVFPPYGEMTPDVLRHALGFAALPTISSNQELVVSRPPTLCAGCPHRGMFYDLSKRKDIVISGDIGCYTLGFAPPYHAMDTCLCMGGAFSVGHGMQKAFDLSGQDKRVVAVLGDSTLFHTGINSLIEVLYNNSKTICLILDNRITGMTGQQENPGSGKLATGAAAHAIEIAPLVRALGFKNVVDINPNDLGAVKKAMNEALAKDEPSVIITTWPCVLKHLDEDEMTQFDNPFTTKYEVMTDTCIGCKLCIKCGCPAISIDTDTKKAVIDRQQCVGCEVCVQICPKKAIVKEVN